MMPKLWTPGKARVQLRGQVDDEDEQFDPIAAMESRLEELRARARAGIPGRIRAIGAVFARVRAGDEVVDDLRRLAHQLRGVAEDEAVRSAAEAVEVAAATRDASLGSAVEGLLALMPPDRAPEAAPDRDREGASGGAREGASGGAREGASGGAREGASGGAPRSAVGSRSLRVLVVDDTASLRKLNRLVLERMGGHHVHEASDVREAFEAAGSFAFDLVLLDAMMPGDSGVDACVELRERLPPQAKLIILSAAAEAELAPSGHQADGWWQKPVPPAALLQRLSELFGG